MSEIKKKPTASSSTESSSLMKNQPEATSETKNAPAPSANITPAKNQTPLKFDFEYKLQMFIGTIDLPSIVNILTKADDITPDEAIRRINKMCQDKQLTIVPFMGSKKQ